MAIVSAGTPFPHFMGAEDYALALQGVRTRDLLADIETAREDRAIAELLRDYEAACWLVLDTADDLGDSQVVARMQAERLALKIREVARRRHLHDRHPDHPYAVAWPANDSRRAARVAAVKAALPVEEFVRRSLVVDLKRSGDHLVGCCPFPGHDDHSPSFHVYGDRAWCFGCNRGGDLIDLAKAALNTTDFSFALRELEAIAGIGGER